jgi:N-acetylmuramoyl-L-alanine amidase
MGVGMKRHLLLLATFVAALVIGLNPLIGPVATAYAIKGEPVQQDSTAEVADSESNSNSTNDPASSPSNKNQVDSDNLAAEENDSSVVADGNGDVLTDSYQYLYIAYPQLPVGVDQVIAFATPNDSDVLTDATLELESTTGNSLSVSAMAVSGNAAAFQFGKDYAECGYDLISISYHLQGDATEHSVDLMQCGYAFDIDANAAVDDGLAEGSANSSVYYSDDSGNAIQAATIGDALTASNGEQSLSLAGTAVNGAYVIALDPGHGGVDPGAQGNGKSEADLTWKIAVACKAKLERYGFKVVMSRGQSGSYGSNDFLYRVQRCVKQGAQAFVSFHINSGSSAAHGAEVYAPTANGTSYTKASVELAQKVMNNLSALGLTYRGVFQMTVGDEFAVIRCAREQGIPGILIEHGFISNSGDVWKYFSDAGCKRLGEADADAIIAQFPRSSWMDYSAVFDADYYLKNNPDVAKWSNNDKDKALQHFINYGMAEGRRGSEAFDVQSYYNEYPDLRAAYGTDLARYYEHYMSYGKSEGRHATGCSKIKGLRTSSGGVDYAPVYDPGYYLSRNDDVEKAYTKTTNGGVTMLDDSAVLRHFINYGMAEGRRGSEAFDVHGYKTRYLDLRKAFGKNLKAYYTHYLKYGLKERRDGSSMTSFEGYIMSPAFSSYEDAAAHYLRTVGEQAYPKSVYKNKGAATVKEFCKILYEEATSEGISPEVLYAQVMKETGYLKFGNLVKPEQCNFGGLGATGAGKPGYTFESVRIGLRAQVQHLKAYATDEPLNKTCVDPRFGYVKRGCAPKTTDLNGKWAVPGIGYGESINSIVLEVIG